MADTEPCDVVVDENERLVSLRRLILFVLFGVIVYLVILFYGEVGRIAVALSSIPWWTIPLMLGLSFLNYVFRYVKWQYFLHRIDVRMPHRDSFSVFLAGFTLTVSPGKIGEAIKGYFCNELRGTPIAKIMPVVVSERVTDLLAMVILAMVGLVGGASTGNEIFTVLMLGGAVLIGAVILSRSSIYERGVKRLTSFGPLKRFQNSCDLIEDTMVKTLAPRSMFVSTAVSVPGWLMECIALWILLCLLTGTGSPTLSSQSLQLLLTATFIHSAASVIGALVFTPGGLVGYEATSIALMQITLGLAESAASLATIIIRFATLWFSVIVGFIALGAVQRCKRDRQQMKEASSLK